MPTTPQKLSPGEFEILKVLWKLESATVAEVRDAHKGSVPAYTTTMTVLGRLVEKEAVRVDKDKQPFRYRAAMRRSTMLRRRLSEFLKTCYEGEANLLMQQLLSEGHLSREAAREILSGAPDGVDPNASDPRTS